MCAFKIWVLKFGPKLKKKYKPQKGNSTLYKLMDIE